MDVLFQAYRQKKWWGEPTRIVIEFDGNIDQETSPAVFRYELHIGHEPDKLSNKVVTYEALFYAPRGKFCRLFERHGQEFQFGKEFGISADNDPRKESIRSDASVISTLAKWNNKICQHIVGIVQNFRSNFVAFNKEQLSPAQWLPVYVQNKECLDQLNRELRRFDLGLESMHIGQNDQGLYAVFKHLGLDKSILFPEESQGTQRFIETFPRIHYVLQTGGVAIIDELDNDLHPMLAPELFRWFTDSKRNPHNAQLLFAAHNPALLDEMEKEQIYFVSKPSGKSTHVYCAGDIKGLRREPSLMKKYLSGELGAVPHIG